MLRVCSCLECSVRWVAHLHLTVSVRTSVLASPHIPVHSLYRVEEGNEAGCERLGMLVCTVYSCIHI